MVQGDVDGNRWRVPVWFFGLRINLALVEKWASGLEVGGGGVRGGGGRVCLGGRCLARRVFVNADGGRVLHRSGDARPSAGVSGKATMRW